jgi:hypothetical protein
MSVYPRESPRPDPMPFKHGAWQPRLLTKGEFAALRPILEAAEGRQLRSYIPEGVDHETAFGSLLHTNYIRESGLGSGLYVLTQAGSIYLRQLRD